MPNQSHVWQTEVDRDRLIDSVCDEFEREFQAGSQPQLELHLLKVEESLRHRLLLEMIPIDLHYRRRRGEAISSAEYQGRFAELSTEQCAQLFPAHGPPRPSTDSLSDVENGRRSIMELAGTRFGNFEILDQLASSSQSVIYQARQLSLNRLVALKFVQASESTMLDDVESFFRVARRAALLYHRYIVPIFEVGQQASYRFYCIAYVEGTSLADKLRAAPLDGPTAARFLLPVCQALQYAHENGVIHGHLKPTNILLDQYNKPRVTDFGLTRHVRPGASLLGLSDFMSPEQIFGNHSLVGPKSDIYSLGALLYRMTTGRPPCQASDSDSYRQAMERIVPPRQFNTAISEDLETIMLKCLNADAAQRFDSVWDLQESLELVLSGRRIQSRPSHPLSKLWHWLGGSRKA